MNLSIESIIIYNISNYQGSTGVPEDIYKDRVYKYNFISLWTWLTKGIPELHYKWPSVLGSKIKKCSNILVSLYKAGVYKYKFMC